MIEVKENEKKCTKNNEKKGGKTPKKGGYRKSIEIQKNITGR